MTAVEFLELMFLRIITFDSEIQRKKYKDVIRQAKEMEENLQLELVHKFVFDYTYNYRGNKTLYEYVNKWHIEYKRLEEIHKNK